MELAWMPAGKFTMGAPPTEEPRQRCEEPAHTVVISRPFYLAVHETTVANFRAFVQASRHETDAEKGGQGALRWNTVKQAWEQDAHCTWKNPGWPQGDNDPVVCISRRDAEAFCYWLERTEGKPYRLPTEAEWEYACRAGTVTTFAFGAVLTADQANFDDTLPFGESAGDADRVKKTAKVGSHAANAWGLADMHGNVWEWCADYFNSTYYQRSPARDPLGPPGRGNPLGVVRGGSWCARAKDCRSAARQALSLASIRNDLGFRVVLDVTRR
jgi:formylglycine-generating enzyme required for sulfatase activity